MGAPDPGEHGRDVPIARVQRFAELAIAPANPREAPLQRRDGNRLLSAPAVDAGGEIEPDGLRIRGEGVKPLAAQPGGKLSPIGVVSALGIFGARVAGVIARLFAERREMRRGVPLRDGRGGFDSVIRRCKGGFFRHGPEAVSPIPTLSHEFRFGQSHDCAHGSHNRAAKITRISSGFRLLTAPVTARKRATVHSFKLKRDSKQTRKIRRLERLSTDQTRNFSRILGLSESCPISAHYRTYLLSDRCGGFSAELGDKAPPWVMLRAWFDSIRQTPSMTNLRPPIRAARRP